MLLFILWTALMGPLATVQAKGSCYAYEKNPYVLFSTYTPYEFVHENSDDRVDIPKCHPVQFWILSRHGTRYIKEDGIKEMWSLRSLRDEIISNLDKRPSEGRLCTQDVENLKKWTPQAVLTLPNDLTPQGYRDAYYLALRYKSRFPTLLNRSYRPDKFQVQFTDTQRTTLTAFAFIDGIFGSTVDIELPQPLSPDPVLKPSDYCTAWDEDVNHNPDSMKEANAFLYGPEMQSVLQSVSRRLGTNITNENLDNIYTTCRFEKAWHVDSVSPWCAAFTKDELKILEYKEDLESYYKRGFGNEMNKHVGCPLAKDLLDRFSKLENGETQPSGVFYFSHDTDIQLFFTSLGVGKDRINITHSNYATMARRNWRTSLLTPFASNFAAIFFKCDRGEPFRVQFRLQEKLLRLKGCPHNRWGLCDWSVIKKKYGYISDTCDLSFCFKEMTD